MQSVKIVVTGSLGAGKTTFIRSVSEITVLSTERQVSEPSGVEAGETTVAMDFGRVTINDDIVLYLFGAPGRSRLTSMWQTFAEGMLGFVLLLDADDALRVDESREMAEFLAERSSVPFVVAINRLEHSDSDGIRAIREGLGLPTDAKIVAVDARDRDSVKEVLLELLAEALECAE